ncbi:MAG: hypothetical protein ACXQTL_06140 [Methanosarcinales archaeon]
MTIVKASRVEAKKSDEGNWSFTVRVLNEVRQSWKVENVQFFSIAGSFHLEMESENDSASLLIKPIGKAYLVFRFSLSMRGREVWISEE